MKRVILIALFFITYFHLSSQVMGNGKMKTITRYIDDIERVSIHINGKVDIICGSASSKIEITYDENIVELVQTKKQRNTVIIDQKEWIEGTKEVQIKIYTNQLTSLENDSWSVIKVKKLMQDKLEVNSSISQIELDGVVKNLEIKTESAEIDASKLLAEKVKVKIKEDGNVFVNVSQILDADVSSEGRIQYKGNPEQIIGLAKKGETFTKRPKIDTRYIDVTFKNKSLNKIHAYVKGPKPNGRYFSYGLSFFPMTSKKERWTIGTKLFKVNKIGVKTLLHEVTADDENSVVTIMGKK